MKVWITKYALTIGIQEVEAEWNERYPNMVEYGGFNGYAHGNDWHRHIRGRTESRRANASSENSLVGKEHRQNARAAV